MEDKIEFEQKELKALRDAKSKEANADIISFEEAKKQLGIE